MFIMFVVNNIFCTNLVRIELKRCNLIGDNNGLYFNNGERLGKVAQILLRFAYVIFFNCAIDTFS